MFKIWNLQYGGVKKGAKWVFNKPNNVPYLRSVFETSLVSGKRKRLNTQLKKIKLMKEIIEIHTNKKDLILDPFMGSASTGVASLELDRKFIGIESEHKYFQIAIKKT